MEVVLVTGGGGGRQVTGKTSVGGRWTAEPPAAGPDLRGRAGLRASRGFEWVGQAALGRWAGTAGVVGGGSRTTGGRFVPGDERHRGGERGGCRGGTREAEKIFGVF